MISWLIFIVFGAGLFFLGIKIERKWQHDADATFINSESQYTDEKHHLDRKNAILVSKVDGRSRYALNTHRIYKNNFGEYFLYIGTNNEPIYFSPISKERAKAALLRDPKALYAE